MVVDTGDILQLCLEKIANGEATIGECLAHYPDVEGLEEMLQAAAVARAVSRPVMSPISRKALEQRLVARMNAAPLRRQPHRAQQWLRIPLTAAATLVLLLVSGLGLVRASEGTVPGDTLYGVKRASEQVTLFFADEEARPGVLTRIAEARLTEIATLAGRSQRIDNTLVTDTVQSLKAAAAAQIDPEKRAALVVQADRAIELVSSNGKLGEAEPLATALQVIATPTDTPTSVPTATPTPMPSETPTPSITPTDTPTDVGTEDTDATADTSESGPDSLTPTHRGPRRTVVPRPTRDKGNNGNGNGDKGNMGNG